LRGGPLLVRVGLTLLLLAALAVGVAGAQDGYRPTFAKDLREDAGGGPLDIVRVALGRTADNKLRAEITMAGRWGTDHLRPGGSVCLRLHIRRAVDAQAPDRLVCATPAEEGPALVGRILRDRANGLPAPAGRARVSRPTARTVFLKFSQSDIGKPALLRFSAEAVTRGEGCPEPLGCRDLGPDPPAARELRLRSTADHR
jgi:hypothetical protein